MTKNSVKVMREEGKKEELLAITPSSKYSEAQEHPGTLSVNKCSILIKLLLGSECVSSKFVCESVTPKGDSISRWGIHKREVL